MYVYQDKNKYFAQIADGTEEISVKELSDLGANDLRPGFRGIHFSAKKKDLYRINYRCSLISRVLAPLKVFKCFGQEDLYRRATSIRWQDFFQEHNTFAVFANVSNSNVKHSKYAALRVKDAVLDEFRKITGKRPGINTLNPDVWISLHMENNRATISIDVSGGPLHKRGYRKETVETPMNESLAAAIIRLSGWQGDKRLYDPMCGSGTLLCESLIRCCRIPPGFLRKKFGFEFLPDFDKAAWRKERDAAVKEIRGLPKRTIYGSDISEKAIAASRTNLACFKDGRKVNLRRIDFRDLEGAEDAVIVCNPPYGIRRKETEDLGVFYKSLGDFLKQKCKGSTAYIYFGEREFIKKIGLRSSWKKPLKNGGLDGRLVKYELY
jgi:putative N6-adenine-specific DNA methylase